jgi:hypothetical protein
MKMSFSEHIFKISLYYINKNFYPVLGQNDFSLDQALGTQ